MISILDISILDISIFDIRPQDGAVGYKMDEQKKK